jgi:hypothetical protein
MLKFDCIIYQKRICHLQSKKKNKHKDTKFTKNTKIVISNEQSVMSDE